MKRSITGCWIGRCGRNSKDSNSIDRRLIVAIPDYESCMVPLLSFLADGQLHTMKEMAPRMADHRTPDEGIESAYEEIRNCLADDLREEVLNCNPTFFERLVLDLLIAMGYGGALPESGTHLGKTHDGGIDGIINEDKLGLDMI